MSLTNLDTVLAFSVIMLLLSLLVTVIVQTVVAVLNLRGWILHWGVQRLLNISMRAVKSPELNAGDPTPDSEKLKAADTERRELAGRIAHAALTHPMVSSAPARLDSALHWLREHWGMATVIRSEELLLVLNDLATNPAMSGDDQVRSALSASTVQARSDANALGQEMKKITPAQIEDVARKGYGETAVAIDEVKRWFNIMMERTSERFRRYTRLLTIVSAGLLAIALHIDALAILHNLSTNADTRAALVTSASAAMKVSDRVTEAVEGQKYSLARTLRDLAKAFPSAPTLASAPDTIATRDAGDKWITENIADKAIARNVSIAFEKRVDAIGGSYVNEIASLTGEIRTGLNDSKLDLIPASWSPHTWCNSWLSEDSKTFDWHHALGIVIAIMLLGLGAPFWFTTLSTLSSLRPALAGKWDKENAPSASVDV